MTEADAEIDALHAAWSEAIRRGDLDAALAMLAPDYVLWAGGAAPLVGRDAARPLFAAAFAQFELDPGFELEERLVSGDLAVDRGWDVQTLRPRAGGPAVTRRQRVLLVLRRSPSPDGSWQYARGMSQPGPAP